MEQQDKRHIPQSSGSPHNAHTRPAETDDKDKLRENPHNDERIIAQNDESGGGNKEVLAERRSCFRQLRHLMLVPHLTIFPDQGLQ